MSYQAVPSGSTGRGLHSSASAASQSRPHLRALLPADSTRRQVPSSPLEPPSAKRKQVSAACAGCRKRKSKCDGTRPTCTACRKRDCSCEYASEPGETYVETLKRKYNQLSQLPAVSDEIYEILRSCQDADAQVILRRIRQGVSPGSLMRQIKEGSLLLQIALVPQTKLRYDFPYIKDMPLKLKRPDNPYLHSVLYESAFLNVTSSLDHGSAETTDPAVTRPRSPYLKPYHAARLIEPLIDEARPSQWTSVTDDNGLLRRLLNSYFLREFQWFPIFHKSSFLEDMVTGANEFCSKLLVNATLARACHCCEEVQARSEFWNPSSLYYRFLAEAKRLWELEASTVPLRLTAIQAAVLIDISYRVNGLDKIGESYLLQAIAAAKKLQIFIAPPPGMGPKMRIARGFTAWSLYSYQTVQAYYFFKDPFIVSPPEIPLPEPSEDQSWYGQFWLVYPMDSCPVSANFSVVHRAKLELHIILNNLAHRLFGRSDLVDKLSFGEAISYQAELDSWYNGLRETLSPTNIVFPTHLKLHIEYHKIIWVLWETSVDLRTADDPTIADGVRARHLEHSQTYFESLLRLYFLRHSFSICDQYLIVFLSTLAFSALDELGRENLMPRQGALISTALLCAKGLYDQAQTCYVAEIVYHLVRDKMTLRVCALLAGYIRSQDDFDSRRGMACAVTKSEWPIPLVNVGNDPELARLENLVKNYPKTPPAEE